MEEESQSAGVEGDFGFVFLQETKRVKQSDLMHCASSYAHRLTSGGVFQTTQD